MPAWQVLVHGAVACFMSHSGWNSTLEGMRNGVPFVCWPYFTDQFQNESYICNVWRTGLVVVPGPDGAVTKEELSGKVERVLGDDGIRERVRALRDAARRSIAEGGLSGLAISECLNRMVCYFVFPAQVELDIHSNDWATSSAPSDQDPTSQLYLYFVTAVFICQTVLVRRFFKTVVPSFLSTGCGL
jgi:hypothetical protein